MARVQKVHPVVITRAKGKTVRALVSVFGTVDLGGDRVMPGAFTNSISEWEASGDRLPFLWSHAWLDPMAHLGVVTSMWESPRGLEVEAEILDDNEFANQVKRLLDQRRVTQFSFAYDVVRERQDEDGARELLELKLIECGPCLSGMHPDTELMSRKSVQEMLAREALSPRDADLRKRLDALFPDADLKARLDALSPVKAAAPRGVDVGPVATVLLRAAVLFEQNAVRALSAGLVDEASILMGSARSLRDIIAGGGGDVQEVIDAVRSIVQALREANPVAGDNLERGLAELAGGTASEYVDNADRVEGSVNVDTPKSRAPEPLPRGSVQVTVDPRMRPVGEPAAAVPVDGGEMYRLPIVTMENTTWEDPAREDTA